VGEVPDVITHVKFKNRVIPLTRRVALTTVLNYRADCDISRTRRQITAIPEISSCIKGRCDGKGNAKGKGGKEEKKEMEKKHPEITSWLWLWFCKEYFQLTLKKVPKAF